MKMLNKTAILATAASLAAGAALAQSPYMRADNNVMTDLGVTAGQIEDADLINPAGDELGEVEAVLVDQSGAVVSVLVELEDDFLDAERVVELPLAGLVAREDDDFFEIWDDEIDLVTEMSVTELNTLPSWPEE
ncbi:hypothetical protein [Euryhalocaulis caribicus]|uniref:hypothetical protein n=1 Tax=Euryhalocaulis caribicus TaxID=1161401 RepID=UPI00039C46F2|nr:hypothetical protein [Euryhalocaulis caribicus]